MRIVLLYFSIIRVVTHDFYCAKEKLAQQILILPI